MNFIIARQIIHASFKTRNQQGVCEAILFSRHGIAHGVYFNRADYAYISFILPEYIDGLVQNCNNSSPLAMELL